MLTSAVSYVPYCEQVQGEREDSGAFVMQVPDYATYTEPIAEDLASTNFLAAGVRSEAYAAEDHEWRGFVVDERKAGLSTDGNTTSELTQAEVNFTTDGREFKTAVGSQCREWGSTLVVPVWFEQDYSPSLFDDIKTVEANLTFSRPTLYDWDTTEAAQQENAELGGQGASVRTVQSKYARAEASSYNDSKLSVEHGAYDSPYVSCRTTAITDATATEYLPTLPSGLENSPIPKQWASEFTGVYTPSVSLCRLEENAVSSNPPSVYPMAIPNWYHEEIGMRRPGIGGVHCSSAHERNTMSIGAMFLFGERSYVDSTGVTHSLNDRIVFGNTNGITIRGANSSEFNKDYDTPPSLSGNLPSFMGNSFMAAMVNGQRLEASQQPWDTHMLSYNPSFVNLQVGSGPDAASRSAYDSYTSTVESEGEIVTTHCEQALDYVFVHKDELNPALPEALRIDGVCKITNDFMASVESAYTIAQAGNSLKNGMIYKLDSYEDWYAQKARTVEGFTRQAKEVFPARITKLSCKPQNSEIQGMFGLSNGTLDQSSRTNGSISPFVDVETQSSPRLLAYMCIDNQFADSDTETVYGRPYIVTSGVVEVEINQSVTDGCSVGIDVSGSTDSAKTVAWPRNVNWATDKFADSDIQMRFLYSKGQMRYAAAKSGGEIAAGGDNVADWGGHMQLVHHSSVDPIPASRLMYTSTPEVRGSSATSYFFADISE